MNAVLPIARIGESRARTRTAVACVVAAASLASLACLAPSSLRAQPLALKRTLSTTTAPGCTASASASPMSARRDNAEARRLAAQAQEAALTGDRVAARDAFRRAAELNPTDERIAYDLARAHEELGDTAAAVQAYCRYLALAPGGSEGADVRARLQRIVPSGVVTNAERARTRFRDGVAMYDRRDYGSAANAFGEVVQRMPSAAEALYDRALARASANDRSGALRDLEAYLAAAPTAEDRAAVTNAVAVLRRPVYVASAALTRGIVPGLGQLYTGRPIAGVAIMGAAAGAIGASFYERTSTRTIPYVDPNGVPVPYTETVTEHPYRSAGLAAAVGMTLAAALEASHFAAGTQRRAARITASALPSAHGAQVRLSLRY